MLLAELNEPLPVNLCDIYLQCCRRRAARRPPAESRKSLLLLMPALLAYRKLPAAHGGAATPAVC